MIKLAIMASVLSVVSMGSSLLAQIEPGNNLGAIGAVSGVSTVGVLIWTVIREVKRSDQAQKKNDDLNKEIRDRDQALMSKVADSLADVAKSNAMVAQAIKDIKEGGKG